MSFPLQSARRDGQGETAVRPEFALNIVVVHEDGATRQWAAEFTRRAELVAGRGSVNTTWWPTLWLSQDAALHGAVQAATTADILVLAVRAGEGLPLEALVWIDAWLPRRPQVTGTLVGLIGRPNKAESNVVEIRNHLQAVASRAQLDLMVEERELPKVALGLSGGLPTTAPAIDGGSDAQSPHSPDWGINE